MLETGQNETSSCDRDFGAEVLNGSRTIYAECLKCFGWAAAADVAGEVRNLEAMHGSATERVKWESLCVLVIGKSLTRLTYLLAPGRRPVTAMQSQ